MKRFSWSWSRFKNFRTCPKRHYHVDIQKDFKEEESEALLWGNQLHDAMAKRIAKNIQLPATMARYDYWPQRVIALRNAGLDVSVENKLAMTEQFEPCAFFDASAWFRCVIDVKILIPQFKAAVTIDWKTGGKVQPEFEQLALSAQTIFVHHPEIDEVAAIYVWFGHDTQTIKVYRRGDMAPVWTEVWPQLTEMTEAARTLTYPPRPSGLCKSYCPVTSCPYHGKGSR